MKEWQRGMCTDGRFMVSTHPLLIPNAKGRSQSLGVRSIEIEGGLKDLPIPSMGELISDGETVTKIHCRPSSITRANIMDGNERLTPCRHPRHHNAP